MEIVPLPSNNRPRTELRPAPERPAAPLAPNGYVVPPLYSDPAPGYYPTDKPAKEESFNLREFARKLWRRKWMILVICAIATTLTALRVSQAKSIYQSTATIEIGRKNPLLNRSGIDYYFYDLDESELKTAVFLLKSVPLLEDVVVNLRLDQNPNFAQVQDKSSWLDLFKGGKEKDAAAQKAQQSAPEIMELANLTLSLHQRPREESERLEPFVRILQGGLSVGQIRGTRLINVSYNHTDPALTELIANGIAQTFRERAFQKQTEKYRDAASWLDRSTRELEAQQQKAEQALADYTRRNNIFSTDAKNDLTSTKLAALHDQVMRAETDRLLKQSLYEEVRRGNVAKLPEAFSNASTNALQQKLGELTVLAAQLSVKFGERNPRVIETREQMAALRKEIADSQTTLEGKLQADYERAVRDENALKAALNRAKSEAVQQNETAIEYNILKQKVETAKSLYTDFLQKTKQADIERAEQSRTVSIAQPGVYGALVGPRRTRTVLLALLLSLSAAIGLVYLLDHLDNRIKTVDDVSRYIQLPALGVIPAMGDGTPRKLLSAQAGKVSAHKGLAGSAQLSNIASLADRKMAHSVAEAYRSLRTSVLLAAAGRPPRTILVTSSQPNEGKTTTTINTAICLSQLGAKVLLIDADMRRPRIHKSFGLKNQRGLSTYLSSDARLRDLIQPTTQPNLAVITSGIVPPNSADLVSSEKMRFLLEKLARYYDHILVDSPPVHSVTDPIILSRLVDGVILVIHGGKSTREMVRHARQELASVGAKIFGVVLNNVDVRQDGYEYYYHNYYYGSSVSDKQVQAKMPG